MNAKTATPILILMSLFLIGASRPPVVKMTGVVDNLWVSSISSENANGKSFHSVLHITLVVETAEPDYPHKVDFVFHGEMLDGFKSARVELRDGTAIAVNLGDTVSIRAMLAYRDWTKGKSNFPYVVSIRSRAGD